MIDMKCIVAVDKNWAIGKGNSLLYSVPEDMKFFRTTTSGHTVICGRKTLESFPGGRPLPKRKHLVLSASACFDHEAVIPMRSVDEVLAYCAAHPEEICFVIGGSRVYQELFCYCDTLFVTKIDSATQDADAFFPNLDLDSDFVITDQSEKMVSASGLVYRFCTYQNKKALK